MENWSVLKDIFPKDYCIPDYSYKLLVDDDEPLMYETSTQFRTKKSTCTSIGPAMIMIEDININSININCINRTINDIVTNCHLQRPVSFDNCAHLDLQTRQDYNFDSIDTFSKFFHINRLSRSVIKSILEQLKHTSENSNQTTTQILHNNDSDYKKLHAGINMVDMIMNSSGNNVNVNLSIDARMWSSQHISGGYLCQHCCTTFTTIII